MFQRFGVGLPLIRLKAVWFDSRSKAHRRLQFGLSPGSIKSRITRFVGMAIITASSSPTAVYTNDHSFADQFVTGLGTQHHFLIPTPAGQCIG